MTPIRHGKRFWKQGEPLVWATGGTLAFVLLSMTLAVLAGVVLHDEARGETDGDVGLVGAVDAG